MRKSALQTKPVPSVDGHTKSSALQLILGIVITGILASSLLSLSRAQTTTADPEAWFKLDRATPEVPKPQPINEKELGPHDLQASVLEQLIADEGIFQLPGNNVGLRELVKDFYHERDYRLAWSKAALTSTSLKELIDALSRAGEHGLSVRDYELEGVNALVEQLHSVSPDGELYPELTTAAELDIRASMAALAFARDLVVGRYRPETVEKRAEVEIEAPAYAGFDLPKWLEQGLVNEDLGTRLQELAPSHPQYVALQQKLAELYDQEWQQLPAISLQDGILHKGDRSKQVPTLVELIGKQCSECQPAVAEIDPDSEHFSSAVESAVKTYQEENGLEADGIVGPATAVALNMSVPDKIERIRLNLDRWRWLPRDLGSEYIMVNIPEYRLTLVEEGQSSITMPVIVGKSESPTPVFMDDLEYLVFQPYWNVPYSIASEEILPKVQEDPSYLEEKSFQVLDGRTVIPPSEIDWESYDRTSLDVRFRQTAGHHNALGLVKFIFPNEYSVYLHDTNAKSLFKRSKRAFSHGCIRVAKPQKLAERLLAISKKRAERAAELLASDARERVNLNKRVPVYITYFSAYVNDDQKLVLRPDIYGMDEAAKEVLVEAGRDTMSANKSVASLPVGLGPQAQTIY